MEENWQGGRNKPVSDDIQNKRSPNCRSHSRLTWTDNDQESRIINAHACISESQIWLQKKIARTKTLAFQLYSVYWAEHVY